MHSVSLIVSCLCIIVNSVHCSNEVPVLAWGSGSELLDFRIPAHRKLSTSEFLQNFLEKLALNDKSAIVTFVEKSLSPEDLTSPSDTGEKSAYPTLQRTFDSANSTKYLPYVSNPLKALEALEYETHELSSHSAESLPNSAKLLFVVKLDGAREDEERLNLLQRHDEVINELCSKIQEKYEKAVCLLTAERKSWIEPERTVYSSRKLLQAVDSNNINLYYDKDTGMIYTKQPPTLLIKSSNETVNLTIPADSQSVSEKNNTLTVTLTSSKGSVRLSFKFMLSNTSLTWELHDVDITMNQKVETVRTKSYIGASIGHSFHTPSDVIFDGSNYALTFSGLQAQYFDSPSDAVFGPVEDTVYFFTIPILSGLFVTAILITIVLIGLTMIFDIKTMDQFDDPKGKTITINASD